MDVYDKIRAVGDSEGWTERTQLLVLCQYVEDIWQKNATGVYYFPPWAFDKFLETKQEAS